MNRSRPLTFPSGRLAPAEHSSQSEATNRTELSSLGKRPSDTQKWTHDFQNLAGHSGEVAIDHWKAQTYWRLALGDVYPRRCFIKLLENEQRRTDRSKSPFSVVHLRFDVRSSGLDRVHEMVALLHEAKRKTDILGYLREDLLGLLLTDTDERGAQRFVDKVYARAPDWEFSMITMTYPGENLSSLVAESEERPSSFVHTFEAPGRATYRLKRSLDIVGSIIGMVLLSPVMLLTAIAVAATSSGPVILKQVRLGRRGVPFVFYKFRSMVVDGDDRIHREYVTRLINGNVDSTNHGSAAKPLYKIKCDPRVTAVGRVIRRTSIDELPQLFNVLKGEMSLVGPRPPLPYEAENYQSWHLRRILEGNPGMTGLWQVEGRSRTSFDEMVRLDLRYIRSCSLLMDLKILIKTIAVVFRCDGAN